MRSCLPEILVIVVLALIIFGAEAMASEISCEASPTKLRVTIKPEQRQRFIKFLQSTKAPFALGANYVGGGETSDWIAISFVDIPDEAEESSINIGAENTLPSAVFVFTFRSCNSTRSLKPYIEATRKRVAQFGVVSIVATASK